VGGVLAFSLVLLLAVLLSELADRTVLSIAVVFLIAGFLLGGLTGVVDLGADSEVLGRFAELALFAVLFTDGMRVGIRDLRPGWRLPSLALGVGLPLTLTTTAVLAHVVVGLPWAPSLLLGAALSPTDPVFAAAIIARPAVPERLRQLLNVESGLNDGLALPVVVILLEVVAPGRVAPVRVVAEALFGVALGVGVPLVAIRLQEHRLLSASGDYAPLYAFAIGLVLFALADSTHANEFLAAFAGGVTVRSASVEVCDAFHRFGESVAELLKVAALFAFGAVLSPAFLGDIGWRGWAFAAAVIVVARPLPVLGVLRWSDLTRPERLTAAWFGPKGFASVVYGLLIAETSFPERDAIVHLVAAAVVLSILVHSSTDVVIARRFVPPDRPAR
jgi:NhaP-type Na+/H+ or K+/H+ antiporter